MQIFKLKPNKYELLISSCKLEPWILATWVPNSCDMGSQEPPGFFWVHFFLHLHIEFEHEVMRRVMQIQLVVLGTFSLFKGLWKFYCMETTYETFHGINYVPLL